MLSKDYLIDTSILRINTDFSCSKMRTLAKKIFLVKPMRGRNVTCIINHTVMHLHYHVFSSSVIGNFTLIIVNTFRHCLLLNTNFRVGLQSSITI